MFLRNELSAPSAIFTIDTFSNGFGYNVLKIAYVAPSEMKFIEIPVKIGIEFAKIQYF